MGQKRRLIQSSESGTGWKSSIGTNKRGQAAIEYFIIATMVMLFMVPIWVHITSIQSQTTVELSLSYAQNTVKQITDVSSLVHSQGSPAKMNIKVYIPSGVQNVSITDKTLSFFMWTDSGTTEIWHTSAAPMQGVDNIPTKEGYFYLDIISRDTYVEINRTV